MWRMSRSRSSRVDGSTVTMTTSSRVKSSRIRSTSEVTMNTADPLVMTPGSMAQALRAESRPVSCSRFEEMFWMMKTERDSLRCLSASLRAALKAARRVPSSPSFLARGDEPVCLR